MSKVQADKILQNLNMLAPPIFIRTEKTVNLIKESRNVVIFKNENFIFYGTATGTIVPIFIYDLQQPTKKLSNPDYFKILEALNVKEDLVINSNRTQRVNEQKKENNFTKKNQAQKTSQLLTDESSSARAQQEEQNWDSFDEWEKNAWFIVCESYGSKVKMFVKVENAQTKYINQLQSFVQTISSRVNRVSKLAPKKRTKKNVS